MPKLKSSKKRVLQNLKARQRNRAVMTSMRSSVKVVRQAADQKTAAEALPRAISMIDRTVKKGVIHRNTGSRYKSRLTKYVAQMN